MKRGWLGVVTAWAALGAACSGDGSDGSTARDAGITGDVITRNAECRLATDIHVPRDDLGAGAAAGEGRLLLRMVQMTDEHVMDDDGQAVNGGSPLDLVEKRFDSAQRMQDEYTDEVLNSMIDTINACHSPSAPIELVVATGDNTDLGTVGEVRRFIDNMDGEFDRVGAFEGRCLAGIGDPALGDLLCTRFSGRGTVDTQTKDPDPTNPLYQFGPTRTILQLLDTELAVLGGETLLRSPGLPPVLRCRASEAGCDNTALAVPYFVAFGNHDGYLRGTLTLQPGVQEFSLLPGRHYMKLQHEFIDEFFATSEVPGPVGHGFHLVEAERFEDGNDRNDGYYAFDAGAAGPGGRPLFRMVVLNTIIDGVTGGIGTEPLLIRNPFSLEDGAIDQAQLDWLRRQLDAAEAAGQLVLVFSHHPDLSFGEFGVLAPLAPKFVTAAELDAEIAGHPNVVAWIAGHTHRNRIRAFVVDGEAGTNGKIGGAVSCSVPGACSGFWQVETASLIDHPQEARLLEFYDHGNGIGSIRATLLQHGFAKSRELAAADDRCQLYVTDPEGLQRLTSDADLRSLCTEGGTREGEPGDRNVVLTFRLPAGS